MSPLPNIKAKKYFIVLSIFLPDFGDVKSHFDKQPGDRGNGVCWYIRSAGLGRVATMNTGVPSVVDAFFWIKPPGESDGVSNPLAPRFDPKCAEGASWTGAPQAGEWFGEGFVDLVQRASPSL